MVKVKPLPPFFKTFRLDASAKRTWIAIFFVACCSPLAAATPAPNGSVITNATPATPPSGTSAAAALAILEAAIAAYEGGSPDALQALLGNEFAGQGTVLHAAPRAMARPRQIRVTLADIRIQNREDEGARAASDPIILQWETRFMRVSTGAPAVEEGHMPVLERYGGVYGS